ncbi:MAG: four helix bundle protein [Chloroflexi bacterium]|nr:four helix bundle protein [Chloroflexota bacterium]
MVSSFRDLVVWQEAHKLVLMIYKTTATFPTAEQFGLTSQMRRAAASVPANLVEGFKRRSQQDKMRFYNIAEASLEELKYFLILSHDLSYIVEDQSLHNQADSVGRLLYRFMTSAQQNQTGRASSNPVSLMPNPINQEESQ